MLNSETLTTSYIRAGAFVGFQELVLELGGNPISLMKQVGIDPRSLSNPDNLISLHANIQIEELAARTTECDYFGLLWGQKQDLSILGAIGLLAKHSPDVGTALENIIKYMHLHAPGLQIELKVDEDGTAYLIPRLRLQKTGPFTQYMDHVLTVSYNVCRFFMGFSWSPDMICLAHRPPRDPKPFASIFKSSISFDADFNGIVFNAKILDKQLTGTDPYLAKLLINYLKDFDRYRSNDVTVQVEKLIATSLRTGNCSIEIIAQSLTIDKRTLQRKLKASGTTFQKLLDKVRSTIALNYLTLSDISMSRLALRLGYSEQSAFIRAFQRWFKESPQRWKNRHQVISSCDRPRF